MLPTNPFTSLLSRGSYWRTWNVLEIDEEFASVHEIEVAIGIIGKYNVINKYFLIS